MGSDAQPAPPGESKYNCSSSVSHISILVMTYKTGNLGHNDLVFNLWSELISKIKSLYVQRLWFVPPTLCNTHTERQTVWPAILVQAAELKWALTVYMTPAKDNTRQHPYWCSSSTATSGISFNQSPFGLDRWSSVPSSQYVVLLPLP